VLGLGLGCQGLGLVVVALTPSLRIAQCLGRRSLAGDFPCPALYLCLTGDHLVDKLSTMGQPTRPTRPSIPSGSANE